MKVKISEIAYHLPKAVESNDVLIRDNPDWDMPKILEKTGVVTRHIAAEGETALELALQAGKKLLGSGSLAKDIDLLILVTQSPDYVLPTSACILQDKLGLGQHCMAFDVNLGCSGFIYALSVAGGLMESGVAKKSLILTADTYSKYIAKNDRTCRPIFSDGAAATLIEKSSADGIGPFDFGTDGSGYDRLIVKEGELKMHGSDVFLFTMRVVPSCVSAVLERAGLKMTDIDLFVFHQASRFVIENLIRTLSLDPAKVFTNYETVGNTVSASIPIALKDAVTQGKLKKGDKVMLIGFGVGLSWGASLVHWS